MSHYRTLRARIHDGPFYAILDSNARISKSGKRSPQQAHYDPFEGMPTYSQRYMKKKNTLPRLSTRPFVRNFFPEELWAVIEPGSATTQRKTLSLSTRTKLDRFDASDVEDEDAEVDDEVEEKEEGVVEDEDQEDEDPDQFDEDEEDDNDDYNAEQYFDGGDDDDFGDEGGGGDDDY